MQAAVLAESADDKTLQMETSSFMMTFSATSKPSSTREKAMTRNCAQKSCSQGAYLENELWWRSLREKRYDGQRLGLVYEQLASQAAV